MPFLKKDVSVNVIFGTSPPALPNLRTVNEYVALEKLGARQSGKTQASHIVKKRSDVIDEIFH